MNCFWRMWEKQIWPALTVPSTRCACWWIFFFSFACTKILIIFIACKTESWTKLRLQTQSDKTNNTELAVLFLFLLNTQSNHTVQAGKSNLYANVSSNVCLQSCVAIRNYGCGSSECPFLWLMAYKEWLLKSAFKKDSLGWIISLLYDLRKSVIPK